MTDGKKVTAIIGSYRKGGIIETVIDEILASAREEGAETRKIYLIQEHIEFCTNCRACTQQEGRERGECRLDDDMAAILDEIQASDAIVLGSPVNFGTVTAVMKGFMERLVCLVYWPWGKKAPKARSMQKPKKAVVVASSAAPSLMALLFTQTTGLLKKAAGLLGARTVGVIFVGLAAREEKQKVPERIMKKARLLGKRLVSDG